MNQEMCGEEGTLTHSHNNNTHKKKLQKFPVQDRLSQRRRKFNNNNKNQNIPKSEDSPKRG